MVKMSKVLIFNYCSYFLPTKMTGWRLLQFEKKNHAGSSMQIFFFEFLMPELEQE